MSYVRVVVTEGAEGLWPTGFVGWLGESSSGECVFNDNFSDYWFHKNRPIEPRVEFETQKECIEWLEEQNAFDASFLEDKPTEALKEAYERFKSMSTPLVSNVEHPSHYNQAGIEAIEAIKASLGDGFPDYCKGNVMKYLWRYKYKAGLEDLKKAQVYLNWMIESIEGEDK
jgi:hypothetical protein